MKKISAKAPQANSLRADVRIASGIKLPLIQSLETREIDEEDVNKLNSLYRIYRRARDIKKQLPEGRLDTIDDIVKSLVQENQGNLPQSSKRPKNILAKIQALFGKTITMTAEREGETHRRIFSYTKTGVSVGNMTASSEWNMQLGTDGFVFTKAPAPFTPPKIQITSVSVDGAKVPFTASPDGKIRFNTDDTTSHEAWEGIEFERAKGAFCKSSGFEPRNKGALTATHTPAATATPLPAYEDRVLWVAQYAKPNHSNFKMRVSNGWKPDNAQDRGFVAFHFPDEENPENDSKVFVSRRKGLATLVVKGDTRSLEEFEGMSYAQVHELENTRVISLKKPTKNTSQRDRYTKDLAFNIANTLDVIGDKPEPRKDWVNNIDVVREVLMTFARIPELKMPNVSKQIRTLTICQALDKHDMPVPDIALDFKGARVSSFDNFLRRSHNNALKTSELPPEVQNLPSGITHFRQLE